MARPKPVSLLDQLLTPPAKPAAAPVPPPVAAAAAVPVFDPEGSPPAKKSDPLPRAGEAYRACAQFLNRLGDRELLIRFVDKRCFRRGFCYADLRGVDWEDAATPGGSPVLVLQFTRPKPTEVRISGQNLEDIEHYIGQHMMPWIWVQPDGFKTKDDRMTVITAIKITELEG